LEVAGNKLIQGYAALKNINEIIVSLAVELAAKDPDNPELQQLNALMAQQAQLIDSLAGAGEGITQGAKALSQGMDTIKGNLDREFIPGMEGLADGISEAVSGFDVLIEGMSRYKKGQAAYKQGLVDYIEGVQKIADGLEELKRHSGNMLSGLEELVKALDNLGKGIADISEKGFPELQDGIVKAIDDMRFAEALLDKMEELVRDYRSFMDNQKNRNSSVQFIMKTDGIVLRDVEEKTDAQDTGESKANWWKRLLKLFGM
jgi:putative membrane protein